MTTGTPIADRLLILLFVSMLSLPLLLTRQDASPGPENRLLEQLDGAPSTWHDILSVPGRFERFFNDHFGFRSELVRLYHRILVAFRDTSAKNVIIGRDGWLFFSDENVLGDITGQRLFTPAELTLWKRYLAIKANALKEIGIPYLFVVVPNKHSIYSRYLPGRYRRPAGRTRTDQWMDYMAGQDALPVMDIREELMDVAGRVPVFTPADTHWTLYGAAVARSRLLDEFRSRGLDLGVPASVDDQLKMVLRSNGDLAGMLNLSDRYPFMVPVKKRRRDGARVVQSVSNTLFARQEIPTVRDGAHHRLLIIGDSTIFALSRLMRDDVAETLNIRLHDHQMRHLDPLVHYIEQFRPDAVIELRIGRLLLATVPEPAPEANIRAYPPWLKKYFAVQNQPFPLKPEGVAPRGLLLQEHPE